MPAKPYTREQLLRFVNAYGGKEQPQPEDQRAAVYATMCFPLMIASKLKS